VVVVEVKYVVKPGRSLYEGKMPEPLLERALQEFDDEMRRYASVVRHDANPVARIRIVTNTPAAAEFLASRAARVVGEGLDLDVQIRPERGA
jgi:hypothetical protein